MSREIDRRKITTYRKVGLLETVARSKGGTRAGPLRKLRAGRRYKSNACDLALLIFEIEARRRGERSHFLDYPIQKLALTGSAICGTCEPTPVYIAGRRKLDLGMNKRREGFLLRHGGLGMTGWVRQADRVFRLREYKEGL